MTMRMIDPPLKAKGSLSRKTILWGAFCLTLVFYSFLVWDSGYKLLPLNYDPAHFQMFDDVEAAGNQGVPYSEVAEEALEAYPLWNNLTAMVTGTYFGFGSNGNSDQIKYYTAMEPVEKSVLSLHMVLGGALLILGIFQFTPSFRKKHRKAHRVIGGLYIVSLFTMSFAAIYHMVNAGVENTYQGYAFHIQLWFLALSTIIAQVLAIYFIIKRNFALHLGFQLFTFVSFLNAPIQRYDWAVFGAIYPHLTQGEVNNLVNILTFWQCLLIGYVLFAWNRSASPLRSTPLPVPPQPMGLKVFLSLVAVAAVLSTVSMYIIWPGLGNWTVISGIVPATTLAADAALYAGKSLQTAGFGVAVSAAIVSGIWLMTRDEQSRIARMRLLCQRGIGRATADGLGLSVGRTEYGRHLGRWVLPGLGRVAVGLHPAGDLLRTTRQGEPLARGDGLCGELRLCASDPALGTCALVRAGCDPAILH